MISMDYHYLTFEISSTCNMASIHPRCPVNDPERYKFGNKDHVLTDEVILAFWSFARMHGFKGIVLWHMYNEPTMHLDRIKHLLSKMHEVDPSQRSHLWTNSPRTDGMFNHIEFTNYRIVRPDDLDNHRLTVEGEGHPYPGVGAFGHCSRSRGWELIIDHHGNWLLCCNDWRNEESFGNVFTEDWEEMLERYDVKGVIGWKDKESYDALPRMCRSCLQFNNHLHNTAFPVGTP